MNNEAVIHANELYSIYISLKSSASIVKQKIDELKNYKTKISFLEIPEEIFTYISSAIVWFSTGGCVLDGGEILGGKSLYDGNTLLSNAATTYKSLIMKIDADTSALNVEYSKLCTKRDNAYNAWKNFKNVNGLW